MMRARWRRVLAPLAATLAAAAMACDSPTDAGEDDTPPVLSVPMVDLSTIREFLPFGSVLSSGVQNPAYEMVLEGTSLEIRAVTAGRVERIDANDPSQGDFELHIRPSQKSIYLVIYDHVLDLKVKEGNAVEPGTVLGRIGNWTATEGRIELQINRNDLSVCPRDLGTAGFNAAHDAALAASLEPAASVCLAETVHP